MFARISRSGGGWWALAAAVVVIAGCKKKPEVAPEAPPETGHQTPEDRKEADLQAFFDGMLVPAPARAQRGLMDPPWPYDSAAPFANWTLQSTRHFGISTIEQLHEVMRIPPEKLTRNQARALDLIHDLPTLAVYWRKALADDPNDAEAAAGLALTLKEVESQKAALEAISKTSGEKADGDPSSGFGSGGYLESIRCELLIGEGRAKDAQQACELALKIDGTFGQRTLAKAYIAAGDGPAAIAQAERALQTWRRNFPNAWFTLGLAQQVAGDEEGARRTWSVAQQHWPKDPFLAKALAGPKRTMTQWQQDENENLYRPLQARNLASCGHFYAEAGITDRSEACFRLSEKLVAGPALAQRLIIEGTTGKPTEVLERAKAAAAANPHPDLLAAVAWLLQHAGQYQEARKWAGQALEKDEDHEKALSLMWQACDQLKDYLCTIEYRQKLGLPTHFNQDQYRDAKKAFDEQNRVEQTGLAVAEPVSVAKPSPVSSITIVPLGGRVPPELADLAPMMAKPLPGLKIELGKPQQLPGMDETKFWSVKGPELLKELPAEPGTIYVVEQDLRVDQGFAFALHDVERGIAVVSLSRFRSYGGAPMDPGTVLQGGALVAAQERVRGQLFASVATLLGLKPSCPVDTCALRNRKTVAAFDLQPMKLCPEHQKQLDQALKH